MEFADSIHFPFWMIGAVLLSVGRLRGEEIAPDLVTPPVFGGEPAPGMRVVVVGEGFPEGEGTGYDERPANIGEVVMGEEIRVGKDGDGGGDPERGEAGEAEMEAAPRTGHL